MTIASGTFGATGASNEFAGKHHRLRVAGTYVATVTPQTFVGGAWVDEGAAISGDETRDLNYEIGRRVRLNCSAYTSGTVEYEHEAQG